MAQPLDTPIPLGQLALSVFRTLLAGGIVMAIVIALARYNIGNSIVRGFVAFGIMLPISYWLARREARSDPPTTLSPGVRAAEYATVMFLLALFLT